MFIPCPNNEIPRSKHQEIGGKIIDEIKEFLDSGLPCAEHIVPDGKKPAYEANCFHVCIRRHNYPVKIVTRNGRIFLARKED